MESTHKFGKDKASNYGRKNEFHPSPHSLRAHLRLEFYPPASDEIGRYRSGSLVGKLLGTKQIQTDVTLIIVFIQTDNAKP